jgi:pimeloyl-ACP methyl ester carboxylesterase
MAEWTEEILHVADTDIALIKGGAGKPLLVLHEELGHPGWLGWHRALAQDHQLIIPVQPGLGKSPRIDWVRSIRELGMFYLWMLRDLDLAPIDVIGFSTGGWVAAEMATLNSAMLRRMVLVAAAGVKPPEDEILDVFAITARTALVYSVHDPEGTPEFNSLYGGERTPEQFEAFEDARTENARLAWEPILYNQTLPFFLPSVRNLPVQIIWGREDAVVPVSAAAAYRGALRNTEVKVALFDDCGHRPEIEKPTEFLKVVREFLA